VSNKAPEGTVMSVSDSGWTKQGIAGLWFTDVFLKNIGPHRPQSLIMDGHKSHCSSQPNNQLITLPGPPGGAGKKIFSLASLANPAPH